MAVARCPFCGHKNRGGLMQQVKPADPTPMMTLCEHYVFEVFTQVPWDYLSSELNKEVNDLQGVTAHGDDIENTLRKHLVFVGPMAFAKSNGERGAAKDEVRRFLATKGFAV